MVGVYIRTEKYKINMSNKLKNRKVTWGDKISKGRIGIKFSKQARINMGSAKKGKHYPKVSESKKGSKNPAWKGGRFQDARGYVLVYNLKHPFARRGYVMEHRLIMEGKLNRYLNMSEIIHHLNGIKYDNRAENLIMMKKGEHINQTEPYKKRIRELEKLLNEKTQT